jgi:hypothetical protein
MNIGAGIGGAIGGGIGAGVGAFVGKSNGATVGHRTQNIKIQPQNNICNDVHRVKNSEPEPISFKVK